MGRDGLGTETAAASRKAKVPLEIQILTEVESKASLSLK